ncbi:MAG: nif-specific transcriptional activator NifA [Thermodesulfobacteriota bacterium]|nr:nif-specific transcriptional activator NifA [Thermodesulfobacteriota bacterium]
MTPTHSFGQSTLDALKLQVLSEICQLIGAAVHLDTTLAKILRILHETLRMERATLVLLDSSGKQLAIRASYGLTVKEEQRGVYKLDEGICGQIFQTCSPFVVPDIQNEPLFLNRTKARSKISKEGLSFIGVPVILARKPVGVLSVDRLFDVDVSFEEDIRFLSVLATLIAQFLSLQRAISRKEAVLVEENKSLKAELHSRFNRHYMIGQSKPMQEIFWSIEKIAPSRATALLLGESGTGKELVARAIHEASPRKDKPFIKVNCAALPENLLESELLGHEKGAFTGATATKPGRFELADKGTLFLDEIGELPLPLQAKLLRVLQERQFERLGGTRTLRVDVRFIAATNVSLEEAVTNGAFRNDLYYRLNVVPIILPPLRERGEDIPLLLDHFLRSSNKRNERDVKLTKKVLDFLVHYNWPGNVRELQNLVERLVILNDGGLLRIEDLPDHILNMPQQAVPAEASFSEPDLLLAGGKSSKMSLKDIERSEIEAALRRHGWIQARAARELGLTQRQIGYKIKKMGLKRPDTF